MGFESSLKVNLDERINGLPQDTPDILYTLSRVVSDSDDIIEIVSELPAGNDPDIILGYVSRWREISKLYNKNVRVYAWSYTEEVEKYVLGMVQNMKTIYVTILPTYLKENKTYGQ